MRTIKIISRFPAAAALAFALILSGCGETPISQNAAAASASLKTSTGSSTSSSTSTTPATTTTTTTPPGAVAFSASSDAVNQGADTVTVTVTRTGDASEAISVDYATADGSAIAGADYTGSSGTLSWGENDSTSQSITIAISSATAFFGTKSFSITLQNPSSGAMIGSPGSATITITGASSLGTVGSLELADAAYSVSQSAAVVILTVNRVGGSTGATSVQIATSDGTALAGSDYSATSSTLNWADGDGTPKSFSVPISNATPFLGAKSFSVTLSAPTAGALLGTPASATVTITGDGSPPVGTFSLSAANYNVTQNAGSLTVSVTRTGGSSGAVSVSYATSGGTAVAGSDYTAANGSLNWADGDTSTKSFNIAISNATPFTGSKTFTVALLNPSTAATISNPGSATVTIAGDAAPPVGSLEFSAANTTVAQNAGSVTVSVARTGGASGAVSVTYATASGTAASGTDFTATSGTLSWADGDATAQTFKVTISNAAPFTGNKSFSVALSDPTGGATIGTPSSAGVTIAGDGTPPAVGSLQLSAATYTVAQSAGSVMITVSRTGGSSGAIAVSYATSSGSAVSGTDFTATSGTLNWANGNVASQSFSVPVSNATPFTGNKTFSVTLSNPGGGAGISSPGSATVTITGDAAPPPVGSLALSASSDSVAQGAGTITVIVNRSGGTNGAVSVAYATANGTALAGTDYTAASGTLNWANGDASSKSFMVAVSNATPFTGTKSFTVALSNPGGGASITSPTSATVTITGDAAPPAVGSLEFSAASYSVGQGGGSVTVTVLRTGGSSGAISVAYATASGTAVSGTNFTAATGTLNWANGNTSALSFTVPVSNATPFSGTKSFTVALSNPTGGASIVAPASATITITGDALPPVGNFSLSAASYTVAQNAGTITVSVSRSGGSYGAASVSYATASGTAVSGTDFTAASGTLNFTNGDTTAQSFTVAVSNATPFTGSKSFTVSLSNPTTGAALTAPSSAAVSITGSGAAGSIFWVYKNGVFNWGGSYSFEVALNYNDTAGAPASGTYDLAVSLTGQWGGWQPYAGGTVPTWDMNVSAYNYITVDLKPTVANQQWSLYFMQVGDKDIIGPNGQMTAVNLLDYGPAPVVGKWATYKVPLSAVLTQYSSGSPVVLTSVYKFCVHDETGLLVNTWYVDNVGFTQ